MKERLQVLIMLLLRTTKTSVFMKTQTAEPGLAGHAATPNQIWNRHSQNGPVFSGPPTIPRVSAVFLHGSILVRGCNNQKSLML